MQLYRTTPHVRTVMAKRGVNIRKVTSVQIFAELALRVQCFSKSLAVCFFGVKY